MREKKEIKILIVDDDEDDFIIIREQITEIPNVRLKIQWCAKYQDALHKMLSGAFDLYLVDYRLGAKSGLHLLKEAVAGHCEEPIILLTGKGNYAVDIEAMQIGAVDYLIKSELTQEKLERSIRYALDRTETMKALKASERKYRNIFEKSKDLVFVTDESLYFLDVNEAALPMLGYDKEEIKKTRLLDLVSQAQHKKFLLQTLRNKKSLYDWNVILRAKTGEEKHCILTAAYEEDYEKKPYIQGIIHDITHLRKIEKATLQAEKMAATGRLIRTLAHEVRNPLNNITLSIEQLLQEIHDETSVSYLDMIRRNSQRISDLITELLNTSRPMEIRLEEHLLQAIVDDVIYSAMDRLTLKRIRLRVSYPPAFLKIKADRDKLKIALLNLIINAIESMEEIKGELALSLAHSDDSAVVRITDNGCGIPEENISQLFEPYFTHKRAGVGLGLAFTLNILQAHKALVDVSSQIGKGTTFSISFPLVGVEAQTAASEN